MARSQIVEVEAARWDALVRGLGVTDVYYTRGFIEASAPLAGGRPALLDLAGDEGHVLFPCIVREDPADVVTPYGYGGPVAVGERPPVGQFAARYEDWCRERGAVSSFVVFHPLFGNHAGEVAAGFHHTAMAGTVAWRLDRGDVFGAMHRHHRRMVRRARAEGFDVAVEAAPAGWGWLALPGRGAARRPRRLRRRLRADDAPAGRLAVLPLRRGVLAR